MTNPFPIAIHYPTFRAASKTPISPKNISSSLGMYLNSEPKLSKSKEFNNQGIKVQVKRTFKGFSFCHQKGNKKGRQALHDMY